MGPGDTSLKYHKSSHRFDGHAEHSQIQESINNTMRHTDYMREDQNNTYSVARTNVTPVCMKSNKGIVFSEDFPTNTNCKNMQPNKYLCVNKKNLAKKYFEMPAQNAVEDDDYRKHGEQHVELLNGVPPLNISWKNLQQNKYLRVDKELLVK